MKPWELFLISKLYWGWISMQAWDSSIVFQERHKILHIWTGRIDVGEYAKKGAIPNTCWRIKKGFSSFDVDQSVIYAPVLSMPFLEEIKCVSVPQGCYKASWFSEGYEHFQAGSMWREPVVAFPLRHNVAMFHATDEPSCLHIPVSNLVSTCLTNKDGATALTTVHTPGIGFLHHSPQC